MTDNAPATRTDNNVFMIFSPFAPRQCSSGIRRFRGVFDHSARKGPFAFILRERTSWSGSYPCYRYRIGGKSTGGFSLIGRRGFSLAGVDLPAVSILTVLWP